MKNAPLVSVITLNYNGMKYVGQYLNSILKTNYPSLEVVIVDNNSSDGSFEFLKRKLCELPRFKIIANCVNQGFAEGNNTGFRQVDSDAKYIVFLNLDTEQDSEWIAELVKAMESDPSIGVAQCKLLQIRQRRLIDRIGGVIDYLGYGYNYGEGEVDSGQYDSMKKVFYADGAALAIRKDVVDEILIDGSVFDSDYFAYHEEVDLCWRARLKGYKVIFVPNSKVYHARGGLTKNYETSPRLLFYHTKNRISSLIKNYGWSNLLKYATLLIYLEFLRSLLVLKQARHNFVAMLKTTFWVVKDFGKIWKKRLYVQHSLRKVPDSEITRYMKRLDIGYLRHKWLHNRRTD